MQQKSSTLSIKGLEEASKYFDLLKVCIKPVKKHEVIPSLTLFFNAFFDHLEIQRAD
jgi:hypothetical protein